MRMARIAQGEEVAMVMEDTETEVVVDGVDEVVEVMEAVEEEEVAGLEVEVEEEVVVSEGIGDCIVTLHWRDGSGVHGEWGIISQVFFVMFFQAVWFDGIPVY